MDSVEAWSDPPKAGQARRVYGLTEDGQRALRAWMGVVKQDRDCLDQVLRRYVATGTIDAAGRGRRRLGGRHGSPLVVRLVDVAHRTPAGHMRSKAPLGCVCAMTCPVRTGPATPAVFSVDPDRSVWIEARSSGSVYHRRFGAVGVTGSSRPR